MKENEERKPVVEDENDPYVYVDGKKEMKDGSGMVKESWTPDEDESGRADTEGC